MSAGLQMLRAVLDHGSVGVFRQLRLDFFTEDEHPAWNMVSDYFSRYGGLPPTQVVFEAGLWLPDAPGAMEYHRDALRQRTIYMTYQNRQTDLMGCIQTGQMDQFLAILEQIVAEMRATNTRRDTFTLAEGMALVMEDFALAQATVGLRGIPYGWPTLDEVTGGARPQDVATIVARPGLGKSFSLARMACSAWQRGYSVGFISMEMSALETARRILAMGSGVNADFIQRGHVSAWGEEQMVAAIERIPDMPPFTLLVGDLSKSTRDVDAMIQEHEPDVIYLDAGYLMKPQKPTLGKRFEQAADTIREIKSLAINRDKPIVQTVQFNRAQKADEDMNIDNIGQSDEIGQISGVVMGMKRGAAPFETTRRVYKVLKNRHGRDHLDFTTRFEHSPFNMDEVEDQGDGTTEDGEWDGQQGEPPTATEWSAA